MGARKGGVKWSSEKKERKGWERKKKYRNK